MSIEVYVPPAVEITNITNSRVAVITTATPHGYSNGIYCTIVIPYPGVMEELNGKTYFMFAGPTPTTLIPVVSILQGPRASFVTLDTTRMSAFSLGPFVTCIPHAPLPPIPFQVRAQKSQVVPSGEIATTLLNASDVIGPRNLP